MKEKLKEIKKGLSEVIDDLMNVEGDYSSILKLLYSAESKLHCEIYKDEPVLKTPDHIKEGLSRINMESFSKRLKE